MSPNPSGRPIRSFVIRASRTTDSQRKALEQYWDTHLIPYKAGPLDLKKHFTESRPLTVEIGFGMGDSLLKMAQADPQSNFLGIEVHKPGIGKLLHGIAQNDLQNLKIMCHDATEIIANLPLMPLSAASPSSLLSLLLCCHLPVLPWSSDRDTWRRRHQDKDLFRNHLYGVD